jgi:hypothetical protein
VHGALGYRWKMLELNRVTLLPNPVLRILLKDGTGSAKNAAGTVVVTGPRRHALMPSLPAGRYGGHSGR